MSSIFLSPEPIPGFYGADCFSQAFLWPKDQPASTPEGLIQGVRLLFERSDSTYFAGLSLVRAGAEKLHSIESLFTPEERKHWHTATQGRQNELLWTRIAAKNATQAMGSISDPKRLKIVNDVFGKPYIDGANQGLLGSSISHSSELGMALVFSIKHPMGIDLEMNSLSHSEAIRSEMTAKEISMFQSLTLPEGMAFTLNWTIKEAYAKALGVGLTTPFPTFEVKSIELKAPFYFESWLNHFTQFRVHSWICGAYALSIAVPYKSALSWQRT